MIDSRVSDPVEDAVDQVGLSYVYLIRYPNKFPRCVNLRAHLILEVTFRKEVVLETIDSDIYKGAVIYGDRLAPLHEQVTLFDSRVVLLDLLLLSELQVVDPPLGFGFGNLLIAFYGVFPTDQIVAIGITNYMYKFAVAILLTPLIYLGHFLIDRYLGRENAEHMSAEAASKSRGFF